MGGSSVVCSLSDLVAARSGFLFSFVVLLFVYCILSSIVMTFLGKKKLFFFWLVCCLSWFVVCLRFLLTSLVCYIITKTYLYSFDPLNPIFIQKNWGFTGVYIIFLISAQKHRLWVLVRTALPRRF